MSQLSHRAPTERRDEPRLLVLSCLVRDRDHDALGDALVAAAQGVAIADSGCIVVLNLDEPQNLGVEAELRSLGLTETVKALHGSDR